MAKRIVNKAERNAERYELKKQATDYLRTARMERHLTGSCR